MGTATLRLGLASLTDTNTRRDASCEQGGSRKGLAQLSGSARRRAGAAVRRHLIDGAAAPLVASAGALEACKPRCSTPGLRTISWGVTPRPREPTAAIPLQRTASNPL